MATLNKDPNFLHTQRLSSITASLVLPLHESEQTHAVGIKHNHEMLLSEKKQNKNASLEGTPAAQEADPWITMFQYTASPVDMSKSVSS